MELKYIFDFALKVMDSAIVEDVTVKQDGRERNVSIHILA